MGDYEIHLKMQGNQQGVFKGESSSKAHSDEIEVAAFSWGMSRLQAGAQSSTKVGRPSIQAVTITKYVDSASIQIMNALLTNETIKTAVISWSKSSGANTTDDFFTVKLTNAAVVSVQVSADSEHGGEGMGSEVVTLSFQRFDVDYKKQSTMGLMQSAGQSGYDLASGS